MRKVKPLGSMIKLETRSSAMKAISKLYVFCTSVSKLLIETSGVEKFASPHREVSTPATGPRARQ
jgi:hypothetical protein